MSSRARTVSRGRVARPRPDDRRSSEVQQFPCSRGQQPLGHPRRRAPRAAAAAASVSRAQPDPSRADPGGQLELTVLGPCAPTDVLQVAPSAATHARSALTAAKVWGSVTRQRRCTRPLRRRAPRAAARPVPRRGPRSAAWRPRRGPAASAPPSRAPLRRPAVRELAQQRVRRCPSGRPPRRRAGSTSTAARGGAARSSPTPRPRPARPGRARRSSASRGSSRSVTPATISPLPSSDGTSLAECTAMSISPAPSARSSPSTQATVLGPETRETSTTSTFPQSFATTAPAPPPERPRVGVQVQLGRRSSRTSAGSRAFARGRRRLLVEREQLPQDLQAGVRAIALQPLEPDGRLVEEVDDGPRHRLDPFAVAFAGSPTSARRSRPGPRRRWPWPRERRAATVRRDLGFPQPAGEALDSSSISASARRASSARSDMWRAATDWRSSMSCSETPGSAAQSGRRRAVRRRR